MCLSCGCGKPNDAHGDNRNITMQDMERAAQASNISTQEVAQNIVDGMRMSAGASMQRPQQSQSSRPQ